MLLKTDSLPLDVSKIVCQRSTERPFSGKYDDFTLAGTYLCRQCGLALFRSRTKFHSGCGWPSFDQEIQGAVKRKTDSDGIRTEIVCARCDAHLGHVFQGEGLTILNTRHCVNSLSLDFVDDLDIKDSEEAILAGGCFWGVEYYFKQLSGVLKVESGYTGGQTRDPAYEDICRGNSGHFEAVRVLYDPLKLNYETLIKYFFEIHDPTQENGQGPDIGQQYQSAIFYYDDAQKEIAERLKDQLKALDYNLKTKILPVSIFWRAEDSHQDYYQKAGKEPYCHHYVKRFKR
ncbi:MAG TPA: bifunctional methionine sulfoxide reductase B/A protein [Gammaproteobacteria bacterium]|nr:bifunctional methionine sulfoxide reductase B/A protein [Gammaproteobacteria bacterium]